MTLKKNIILLSSFFFCYNAIAMDSGKDKSCLSLREPFAVLAGTMHAQIIENPDDLEKMIKNHNKPDAKISSIINQKDTFFINLTTIEMPKGQENAIFLVNSLKNNSVHALIFNNLMFPINTVMIINKTSPLDLLSQKLNADGQITFPKVYALLCTQMLIIESQKKTIEQSTIKPRTPSKEFATLAESDPKITAHYCPLSSPTDPNYLAILAPYHKILKGAIPYTEITRTTNLEQTANGLSISSIINNKSTLFINSTATEVEKSGYATFLINGLQKGTLKALMIDHFAKLPGCVASPIVIISEMENSLDVITNALHEIDTINEIKLALLIRSRDAGLNNLTRHVGLSNGQWALGTFIITLLLFNLFATYYSGTTT